MVNYLLVALQELLVLLLVPFCKFNREHLGHCGAFSAITAEKQAEEEEEFWNMEGQFGSGRQGSGHSEPHNLKAMRC